IALPQTTAATSTYRLKPEDVITINIYRVQEVDAVLPIGPDGNISAPFVGTIQAAGKTTKELEHELAIACSEKLHLQDPIVSVTIRQFRLNFATATGAVARGGQYQVRPGDRVSAPLAKAGGTTTTGSADLRR